MATSLVNINQLEHVRGLRDAIAQGFKPTEQIRLSPSKQFVAGKAALVFASPHVVDASKDLAEFGFIAEQQLFGRTLHTANPPYEGACAVGWF